MTNVDPKYAEYHALLAHQADVTDVGGCNCCASVVGRTPSPRRYWWTGQTGNRRGLCESCLRSHLENALDDPDLLPAQVTLSG